MGVAAFNSGVRLIFSLNLIVWKEVGVYGTIRLQVQHLTAKGCGICFALIWELVGRGQCSFPTFFSENCEHCR